MSEGERRMFGFDLHGWEALMLWSLTIAALAAVAVVLSTRIVILLQREENKAKSEELAKYQADAGIRIAEALTAAAKAHERAADLERQTELLRVEAERAKESAALANKQILEMKRMRRLEKPQAEALRPLLTSKWFQSEPKAALRVSAVSDAEAETFALELMRFFESCGVNIYPTNGGLPNGCTQGEPNAHGLVMALRNATTTAANQPFARFQVAMEQIGFPFLVEENPRLRDGEAILSVLKKP